jgi:hypothetical protein
MRGLIEDADSINARQIGRALPDKLDSGKVEIEISGMVIQEIEIVSTPGQFGGFLRWFICPGCNRRTGRLYLPISQGAFLCRHCYKLGYRQQLLREFRKTQYEKKIMTKLERRNKERLGILKELIRMLRAKDNFA